ncbi:oxidoreductase [Mucilaginibacter phyllosphaerae]|uniref:NAD(P)-dependent dehydrogenase (Short-subunit alcohol dehydrogenase family) n=1 Tax=Mucilaginibacter phyllosphaerae TaxID=1812349 RepID=A0A4Y8AHR3_9SPHI|nr:oxidoreductase [Mucilaginibacter phyllosphaerae]MBB3968385.1 NAD(P)-dependent dehydrogenase (short-subunit alcohol dehydrogenase family) [Mucilaginibacter phyllosphaerae]TEW68618.1 SDR family NAD(P)-dependent oxidoreductase [Mucilaginibacter phyllosphaerae]GGG99299.1 short-chain dehydrogenase/reductase [Mucilaginibacter phyllosphaerae]
MTKIWFITGASRGLGRSLTEAVLAQGDKVAATARKTDSFKDLEEKYPGQVYPLNLDVTNYPGVHKAIADTVAHFGRIDVLVNNAGFGITGAVEGYTDEQVRSQLETNLYAPIEITRAVLPYMRKQRSGHVLQISSMGGRVGSGGVSIYQAAKFGLSGFSEGLAVEVAPLGIKIICVEPGGFRTDWSGGSMTYAPHVAGYETTVDERVAAFKNNSFKPVGDPAKAAAVMINLVNNAEPPLHLLLGSEAFAIVKHSEEAKLRELEKWQATSLSTDADDAENFLETEYGKRYLNLKK